MSPSGIFHFLNRKKIIDQARLPTLGVAPEHRDRGFELAMIYDLCERAIAKGYKRCECSWTLEANRPMIHVIGAGGAKRYKTYRIYRKDL